MKKALGLIESKGLVALVEAADVILKNSPVEILWIKKLNNGLVTLAISGETDYVNAVMDSAVEAANRVGEVHSHSVIENPGDKLMALFADTFNDFNTQNSDPKSGKNKIAEKESLLDSFQPIVSEDSDVNEKVQEVKLTKKRSDNNRKNRITKEVSNNQTYSDHKVKKNLEIDQKTNADIVPNLSTIERLRKEALGLSVNKSKSKIILETEKTEANDASIGMNNEIDLKSIQQMNVHKLRHYAREFENFPIKGRQISRANRDELVEIFKKIIS